MHGAATEGNDAKAPASKMAAAVPARIVTTVTYVSPRPPAEATGSWLKFIFSSEKCSRAVRVPSGRTQHYADFDVQVRAVLGPDRGGDGRFEDAARFLEQLFVAGLRPKG